KTKEAQALIDCISSIIGYDRHIMKWPSDRTPVNSAYPTVNPDPTELPDKVREQIRSGHFPEAVDLLEQVQPVDPTHSSSCENIQFACNEWALHSDSETA